MAQPTNSTPILDLHPTLHNMHVNVKMFGAVGDGSNDDTAAIQAAINASASGETVYFPAPSNYYNVTSTISLSQKRNLHLVGSSTNSQETQFGRPPQVPIIAPSSLVPVFSIDAIATSDSDGVTMEGLNIKGGCPLRIRNANNFVARHCSLVALNNADADNGAVVVENSFWHWYEHCTFHAPQTSEPSVILRGKTATLSADICYLMKWADCTFASGGVHYSQVNDTSGQPGRFTFDTCSEENFGSGMALFKFKEEVTCSTTSYVWNVSIVNNELADPAVANNPLIRLECNDGLQFGYLANCNGHARIIESISGATFYTSVINCGNLNPVVDSGGSALNSAINVFQTNSGHRIYGNADFALPPKLSFHHKGTESTIYTDDDNRLKTNKSIELPTAGAFVQFLENGTTDAAAGAVNTGRLYVRDNGSGKTQLCVRFNTGAIQVIAEQV